MCLIGTLRERQPILFYLFLDKAKQIKKIGITRKFFYFFVFYDVGKKLANKKIPIDTKKHYKKYL